MQQNELLTIDEFCDLIKVSRRTAYRWIKSGRLKAKKAGRLWRVPREAVEEFLIDPE